MGLARFVAFHDTSEHDCTPTPAFAVMIARSPQGAVLVFSRYRHVWELPGGLIDPGETPRRAAERELEEEAGCTARNTRWLGVVEVEDGRSHFGAVFECETDQVPAGFENAETVGVDFWNRGRPAPRLETRLGHSDAALLARFG